MSPHPHRSFVASFLVFAVAATAAAETQRPAAGKKLLVLGGTNFIGVHLVPYAMEQGFEVTLFTRGKTNPDLFPEVEKLKGDRDPEVGDGLKALEGRKFDAVIDTSGHVPRHMKASCALLADESTYYCFVSSLSAYAGHDVVGADETDALAPLEEESEDFRGAAFGPLKALCERAAQEAFPGRCAIVRPGLIVGPPDKSDRFTYWVARLDRGGDVLAPGNPDDPIMIIDVRDLAEWLVRMAIQRTPGVFNAIGPDRKLTIGELIETCKEASGKESTLHWASAEFLESQGVAPWTDLPVWIPPTPPMSGFHRRSNAAAIEAGLKFRPLSDTVKTTLDWWRTLPEERRARTRVGLTAEREATVLEALKAGS